MGCIAATTYLLRLHDQIADGLAAEDVSHKDIKDQGEKSFLFSTYNQ